MVFSLLEALEDRGTTPLLLRAVLRERPKRPDLPTLFTQLCPALLDLPEPSATLLSAQRAGQTQAAAPVAAASPGFERNVRPHLTKVDVRVWLDRLARIERQVCRVEIGGNAAGTGFLVGEDVVLTNFHVVEGALAGGRLADVACRFGYLQQADQTRTMGDLVRLHSEGCLDSSPYSAAEKANNAGGLAPTADELDYALLRLERPAGRGWIALLAAADLPAAGSPLLILQHPDGAPMKLAMDTQAILGANEGGTRIRYSTNTEPGSSGSPCFSMDWDLVALHHLGDPAWNAPTYNQGVPIGPICRRLLAHGCGAALGGVGA